MAVGDWLLATEERNAYWHGVGPALCDDPGRELARVDDDFDMLDSNGVFRCVATTRHQRALYLENTHLGWSLFYLFRAAGLDSTLGSFIPLLIPLSIADSTDKS